MRRYDFTLPRHPDGRYYVQVIEHQPDPNQPGEVLIDSYPMRDEAGQVPSFDNPMQAWTAAMIWRAQQQAQQ